MKKTWKCCLINLQQWRSNPKYVLFLVYLLLLMCSATHDFSAKADALGYAKITPWFLPIGVSSARLYPLLLLGFLILICDLPLRTSQQQFVLLRTGKRTWLSGQLLYLLLICVFFSVLLWVSSWLFYATRLEWTSRWGKFLRSTWQGSHVFINSDGLSATLWTVGMQTLICYFLGLLAMLLNLCASKGIGIFLDAGLILFSFLVRLYADAGNMQQMIWISPVSWIDRSLMGHTNQNLPPAIYGVGMGAALCLVLIGILYGSICKYNLELNEGVM